MVVTANTLEGEDIIVYKKEISENLKKSRKINNTHIQMYTLRNITKEVQTNTALGNQYQLVNREENYDEFCKVYENTFKKPHIADLDTEADNFSKNCYSFIIFNGGSEVIPLYKNQNNYIMTESGKTFSNLTYK